MIGGALIFLAKDIRIPLKEFDKFPYVTNTRYYSDDSI